jgi:cation transport ATPase
MSDPECIESGSWTICNTLQYTISSYCILACLFVVIFLKRTKERKKRKKERNKRKNRKKRKKINKEKNRKKKRKERTERKKEKKEHKEKITERKERKERKKERRKEGRKEKRKEGWKERKEERKKGISYNIIVFIYLHNYIVHISIFMPTDSLPSHKSTSGSLGWGGIITSLAFPHEPDATLYDLHWHFHMNLMLRSMIFNCIST